MKKYKCCNDFRGKNQPGFLVFCIALSIGASVVLKAMLGKFAVLPPGAEAVLAVLFFLALEGVYERVLWRNRLFYRLGIHRYPDLSGRWVGFLTSSYQMDGQSAVIPISLEISQSCRAVFVRAGIGKAYSESAVADFGEWHNRLSLYYLYDNSVRKKFHGHLGKDRGAVILHYDEAKKRLKGTYFNDIKPRSNSGEIEVFYSGPKLYHS